MASNLLTLKSAIQQKAIQKFPFTLNNQTYFSSQCFYENTIINGISLQVKQARGISNQEQLVGYLVYSNRLIFYAGANILTYNTYKRKYEIICEAHGMLALKASSLSTDQKQYVIWVDRIYHDGLVLGDQAKIGFQFCVYDMMGREKIYQEQFHTLKQDLKPHQIQIIAFMHPCKLIGVLIADLNKNQTRFIYKKAVRNVQQADFGEQIQLTFPFLFKKLKYDLESNSYFLMKNQEEIWALQISCDKFAQDPHRINDNSTIEVEKVLFLKSNKKLGQRKLIDYAISETYLILLTVKQNKDRQFQFYSLFSYGFILNETIWTPPVNTKSKNKSKFQPGATHQQVQNKQPIDRIEFNKNIIIGLRNNSCEISIYSINDQSLRHIRDSILDLSNCHQIQKIFINPFSSEAMVLSRHYELEGMITTEHKSSKIIRKSQTKCKRFYLQISSFFITAETSTISVSRMRLQKQNYVSILTAPWLSEFYFQTDNLIKSKRWTQKFDVIIKCSAIHPTGQYIALGFNDSFKIYFLTHQGLVPTYVMQNVKQCTSLAYSKSGNDFAAATSTTILIYDCYSYQKKHQVCLGISYRIQQIFYTHCKDRSRIKQSLQCITNTKRIVSYNADQGYRQQFSFNPKSHVQNNLLDGIMSLMQTRLDKLNHNNFMDTTTANMMMNNQSGIGRNGENNNQNCSNSNNNKKIGAIFYDQKVGIVIFSIGNKIYFINCVNFQSLGCFDFEQVSCIEICRSINTLFFGTATGKIIAFPWPNKPINITSRIPTFSTHRGRIKKIKISSNLFELISITDQSMYIHSLTVIHQMRKIKKYQLQRQYNNKSLLAMNFYLRAGFCLMTHQKYQQKCQEIKEFQQQAVNMNFMMPQQREKQKIEMLNKLEDQREKICMDTQENGMPLKIQALNAKDKIKGLEKQIKINTINYENTMEKQKESYRKILSKLSSEKDELFQKQLQVKRRLQKQVNQLKVQLKKEIIKAETVYRIKLDQVNRKANEADFERKKNLNNFKQLDEMDKEKDELSRNIIQDIQNQITVLHQRNGYLACRNTNIEKDLQTKRRKIQDIKQLIQNTTQSIELLPRKAKREKKPQDIKQQQTINRQFAQTQRKYLKETKKLIQKNKAVNVSIQLYEKQREMLVILDREREKQQRNIDGILEYIMKQREQKQVISSKVAQVKAKAKNILTVYQAKNAQRIRAKNILKEYLYQITLFQQGVTSLQQLKKISQIAPEDMIGPPQNIQLSIDEKKIKIENYERNEELEKNILQLETQNLSTQSRFASQLQFLTSLEQTLDQRDERPKIKEEILHQKHKHAKEQSSNSYKTDSILNLCSFQKLTSVENNALC